MFTPYTDYIIQNAHVPVLTRQDNNKYDFRDCYFLEFVVRPDWDSRKKIEALCEPFDFMEGVRYEIIKNNVLLNNRTQRLFILATPIAPEHDFFVTDDLLAMAFCTDEDQSTTLDFFEVNYKFRHGYRYEPNQKYRRVGTSAIDALKKVYKNRELRGRSALEALTFWLKNDFTHIDNRELYVHWHQR